MVTPADPRLVIKLRGKLWSPPEPSNTRFDDEGTPMPISIGRPGGGNRYATREDARLAYKIYKRNWMRKKRLKQRMSRTKIAT